MYGNPGNPGLQPAVLIHEGQITYERHGLRKIMDLGEWWFGRQNYRHPSVSMS